MNVMYLCNFDINGYSGKNRATRQKLNALKKQVNNLIIISSQIKRMKFLELFFLEIKAIYMILKYRPDLFISRGFVGYLPQKLCKLLRISTVREVHADIIGEIQQTNKNWLTKKLVIPLCMYSQKTDISADMRIFNHPDLLNWFKSTFFDSKYDIFVYNGFNINSKSELSKEEARKKYGLKNNIKYLVFTGSSSYWHGVDYLVNLQKNLNKINSNIKIICGGGIISKKDDPDGVLINLTPLDDIGCSELIQASDACLLPVRQSRVSPGSPLKLYDYILHEKYVITQKNVNGYDDEVKLYGFGSAVEFNDSIQTSSLINDILANLDTNSKVKINSFSWDKRIHTWLNGIFLLKNNIDKR